MFRISALFVAFGLLAACTVADAQEADQAWVMNPPEGLQMVVEAAVTAGNEATEVARELTETTSPAIAQIEALNRQATQTSQLSEMLGDTIGQGLLNLRELQKEQEAILAALTDEQRRELETRALAEASQAAVNRHVGSTTWVCLVAGEMQYRDSWGEPRSGGRTHEGIDIMARWGTPMVAPKAGELTFRYDPIGGKSFYLTTIEGDVWFGTHLSSYATSGWVEAGTVIGYIGRSGNAVGNHVHFEYRPGGNSKNAVNPFPIVEAHCENGRSAPRSQEPAE
ncbi:MAG TPA: M23 family metallopeptidase [Acidimicrobiia bacterium]|jgi:murein DD-endopeptidase MepM/ murein hydrolase activator NlpD|nr:M23 family metallopeptidase [Acidimicrobiia bacterium]HIL46682.1 M23 family metallopeptidase [Acidimicrobiia bacterium]